MAENVAQVAGLGGVVGGLWMAWEPLGWIVGGLGLVLWAQGRGGGDANNDDGA